MNERDVPLQWALAPGTMWRADGPAPGTMRARPAHSVPATRLINDLANMAGRYFQNSRNKNIQKSGGA